MNLNTQLQHLRAKGLTPIPLETALTHLPVAEQQKLFLEALSTTNPGEILCFHIHIFPELNQRPIHFIKIYMGLILSYCDKFLPTPTVITISESDINLFFKITTKNVQIEINNTLTQFINDYPAIISFNESSKVSEKNILPGMNNSINTTLLFSINGMYTPPNPSLNALPDVSEGFKCNARRNLELIQNLPCIPEMGVHSGRHKLLFAFYGIAKNIKSKADAIKLAVELNNRFKIPLSNNELLHQLSRVDQHDSNGYRFSDRTLVTKFLPITMEEAVQCGFLKSTLKKESYDLKRDLKSKRDQRIRELRLKGVKLNEIEKILKTEGYTHCSRTTIKTQLELMGLTQKRNTDNVFQTESVSKKVGFSFKAKAPALASLLPTEGFDLFHLKKNTWITGLAGAGKTTLLFSICEELKKQKKRILITAAYGIAAQHAGGDTICHSLAIDFSVVWDYNSPITTKDLSPLLNIDVLVIDEIGTCRPDVFNRIARLIEKVQQDYQHHVQLIVVGDFLQIQSFYSNDDIAYAKARSVLLEEHLWDTESWNRIIEQVVFLEGSCRTENKDFHRVLSNIAMGTNLSETVDYINEHTQVNRKAKGLLERMNATLLAAHRTDIEKVNQSYIEKHKNDSSFTLLEGTLDHDTPSAIFSVNQTIPVWIGMRAMTVKNGKRYKNGTCGVVTKITKSYLEMSICDEIIKIYKRTFFERM